MMFYPFSSTFISTYNPIVLYTNMFISSKGLVVEGINL